MAAPGKPNEKETPESKLRRPRDIIFVLDSSGSIYEEDFERALMFMYRIVSLLDISQTHTRVALVNYGTRTKAEFSLHHHSSEKEIQKAIMQVSPMGGSTRTSDALEKAIKICEHRHNTPNPLIVILITDGHSDNKTRAAQMSNTLKQQWGAHFFAIGVGSGVNRTELGGLASSKENVLLVDDYNSLKTVREKVATKLCSVVPRPRFSNTVSVGPKKKVVFIGTNSKETEHPNNIANKKMIEFIRDTDEKLLRTELVLLTCDEENMITAEDLEKAKSQGISLVGAEFPYGCTDPNSSDFDVYTLAFFQKFLHSNLSSDITHIVGFAPYTGNAMHNIAKALAEKSGEIPKTILLTSGEIQNENTKKCIGAADAILCLDNTIGIMEFVGQNLEKVFGFNINAAEPTAADDEGSDEPDVEQSSDDPDAAAAETMKIEEPIHNPKTLFMRHIYDGINLDFQLTTTEDASDSSNQKLQTVLDVVHSVLESRGDVDSKTTEPNPVTEAWLRFILEIEVPSRKILGLHRSGDLSFRVEIFCPSEQSVKELWEQCKRENPVSIALDKALHASEVSYETCEILIKSEVQEKLVASVIFPSAEYLQLVKRIISSRKKEQDKNWTTVHGAKKDKKIADEIEKRRLERKWEEILDEARSLTGERGVQALEKAREEYDNFPELVARIEASREAGSFMEFMKDIISTMCCIM